MNIIKYSSDEEVNNAILTDEPLLALISFDGDGSTAIMSHCWYRYSKAIQTLFGRAE
ncbi:MAG: hypothetical protein J6Y71_01080 [Ruminococcus sp.]|nr:hypothetical protein [Ruminococcus sp.]